MVPSASLTPPLAHVERASAALDGTSRRHPVADGPGMVGTVAKVPALDFARYRQGPMSPKAERGDASGPRDGRSFASTDRNETDTRSSVRESEAMTLRRILDIRARSETAELVELPVPVTEILRISMEKVPADPVAGVNARSLYEGMQGVFSRDASSAPRSAPDTPALQAA